METSIICYHREVDDDILTIEEIIANIHVIDNYSEVTIVKTINQFTGHETEKGEFIVTLTYEDISHNQMDVTVTIMNEDHTIPNITSALTLHSVSYTYTGDIHSILNTFQISVIDNYDGALDYMIVADTYTPNACYVGQYTVTIQAIDSSGNINTATYQIDVIDDVPPYFYIDNNIVTVNVGELLSTQDIMTLLKMRKLTKPMSFSIDIIRDDYTENRHQAGEYEMVIDVQYENGEVEQKVLIFKVRFRNRIIPAFGQWIAS